MRSDRITPAAPSGGGRIYGCRPCYGYGRPGYVRTGVADPSAPGGSRFRWDRCPAECTPESRAAAVAAELSRRGITAPAASTRRGPMRCGSDPRTVLIDADRQAVADFREHLRGVAANADDDAAAKSPAVDVEHGQDHADTATDTAPDQGAAGSASTTRTTGKGSRGHQVGRGSSRQESRRQLVAAVALDIDGGQLVADTADVPAPDDGGVTLAAVFAYVAAVGPHVGVPRLHADVRGSDGAVCLSAAVVSAAKLPAKLPATAAGMERAAAKLRKAAAASGLELGESIGAGFKAFRRAVPGGAPRLSVRVLVVPWLGQGDKAAVASGSLVTALADDGTGTPDAVTLARRIRRFVADIGVTPGATAAVTSRQLLEAVRPRFGWTQDDAGRWKSELRPGALPDGDTAVPMAAGARHPLTRERVAARERVCEEEDFKWWARELSAQEAAMPYAVAVDACASYLSVTETLRLPAGPLEHTTSPRWDKADAGLWLCDFTGLPVEPELPHFATFTGQAPTGPGWYTTPTVAYAVTAYGYDPAEIREAYVSGHTVAFLKEWTQHVRAAYKAGMGALGVPDTLTEPGPFVAAWSARKAAADPDAVVLVDAYKAVYKGGVGKWTDSAKHRSDDDWREHVAAAWHYRPEVRHHIIAAARIAGHRRMRKTLALTGRAPFAINVDQLMYAAPAADLGSLLAVADGRPVPGTVRLGSAPGSYKWDASVPMPAVLEALAERVHPSGLTHDYDVTGAPVGQEG